jgi:hypothetical protein
VMILALDLTGFMCFKALWIITMESLFFRELEFAFPLFQSLEATLNNSGLFHTQPSRSTPIKCDIILNAGSNSFLPSLHTP